MRPIQIGYTDLIGVAEAEEDARVSSSSVVPQANTARKHKVRQAVLEPNTKDDPRLVLSAPVQRKRRRARPLFLLGSGMMLTLVLLILINLLITWAVNEYDNIAYGTPRTFQMDAVVGDGDSPTSPSHFVAINLKGSVTVEEWPGGDRSKIRVVATMDLINDPMAVVTLKFVEISGKHTLVVSAAGNVVVMVDDGGKYRLPNTSEMPMIQQALAGGN